MMLTRMIVATGVSVLVGCASGGAAQSGAGERTGETVAEAVHTPVEFAGAVTLERVTALALERHHLVGPNGGAPSDAARVEHERVVRHRAAVSYAAYVRTFFDKQVREGAHHAVEQLAQSARAASPSEQAALQLELAQLHLDARRAEQESRIAQAVLNAALSRAPDADVGTPSDADGTSVRASLDDLVARAMHQRTLLGEQIPEHVVRGEVAVGMRRLEHLGQSWQIFQSEAAPAAARLGALPPSAFPSTFAYLQAQRLVWQTQLERAERLSELIIASSELEFVVADALERTPASPAPAPMAMTEPMPAMMASTAPMAMASPAPSAAPSPAPMAPAHGHAAAHPAHHAH